MKGSLFAHDHVDEVALSAYHDAELRGFAREDVEQHLAHCARCRGALAAIASVEAVLGSLLLLEPPAALDATMRARVGGIRRRHRSRRCLAWGAAAAVAALAALVGGYDALTAPHGAMPAASAPAAHSRPVVNAPARLKQLAVPSSSMFAPGGSPSVHGPAQRGSGYFGASLPGSALNNTLAPGVTGQPSTASPPVVDARLIERSGEVDLRVRDVQRSFNAVASIAVRQGGYVSDSSNSGAGAASSGQYNATLTLHVPAASFQKTLDALAALPHTALAESSTSADVTDSFHDLQAQVQAQSATRAQLMILMRRARTIEDAMSVLDRLTGVNTTIDSLQSQILADANSVMLSSLVVNLSQEPRQQQVSAPARWQPGRDLTAALGNVAHSVQAMISFAIYAAVYLALPSLLIAFGIALRRLRRWTPRRT